MNEDCFDARDLGNVEDAKNRIPQEAIPNSPALMPPVDGEANAALVAWLAQALGLRKADIEIRSGQTGRLKMLHLAGDSAVLTARLAALCQG